MITPIAMCVSSPDRLETAEAMATAVVTKLMSERHSCRGFLRQPLPRQEIEQILAMAQKTASWCNSQPWQIFMTDAPASDRLRAVLLAHMETAPPAANDSYYDFPPGYYGLYKERQRECGLALYDAVGIARADRQASAQQAMRNFALFDAPHMLVITSPVELGVYGAIDCGGFAANFMLAAQSFGVATIAQAALAMASGVLRSFFEIPDHLSVLFGISFGYEDRNHPANQFRTTRARLDQAVSWVNS